jgi:uncharacterized protein
VTSDLTRRGFLGRTAAAGLGIVFAGSIEAIAGPGSALAALRSSVGYGDLIPDPAGLLALPPGFSYRLVSQSGVTPTADGVPAASDPDGTGVFVNGTGSTLVNNHEVGGSEPFGVPTLPGLTYDAGARGARPTSRSTPRATGSPSTPAWPAPTTTASAASPRGRPG